MPSQSALLSVDWSRLPAPVDDGAARHLLGARLPSIALPSTSGARVDLSALPGRSIVYAYPMTGRPDVTLPEGWDEIPGARGCTPQSCAFRDHYAELQAAGASHVFGISTQSTDDQREAAARLHIPFALLSDAGLELANAMRLPALRVGGSTLLKRLALVIDDGVIARVCYPVFPPDRNAADVLDWLRENPI